MCTSRPANEAPAKSERPGLRMVTGPFHLLAVTAAVLLAAATAPTQAAQIQDTYAQETVVPLGGQPAPQTPKRLDWSKAIVPGQAGISGVPTATANTGSELSEHWLPGMIPHVGANAPISQRPEETYLRPSIAPGQQ